MKRTILFLAFILFFNWIYAQTGSITNIQVNQGTGVNERVLDLLFDLSGNDLAYDITLEVSFDNGGTYTLIDPGEVTGALTVSPGTGIHLVWDGRINYSAYSTDMARLKIIATTIWQCGNPVTDSRDGQIYNTVLIGSQCWMKENLNYATTNSWCYDNNSSNCDTYGRLYDWETIMNGESSSNGIPSGVQGICPSGWHVPSDAECDILDNHLGGLTVAGGKMKEVGYEHWISPNTGATNESGFTALPGGYRSTYGSFGYLGRNGHWWSSTESSGSDAWRRYLGYDHDDVLRYIYYKTFGFSLRCLKD